jgi:hypothetical protein
MHARSKRRSSIPLRDRPFEDGKDLLNEADVEHATIKGLVSAH